MSDERRQRAFLVFPPCKMCNEAFPRPAFPAPNPPCYNARPAQGRPAMETGDVAEWFKAAVLKTADGVTHP